jgi:hypothetical protein
MSETESENEALVGVKEPEAKAGESRPVGGRQAIVGGPRRNAPETRKEFEGEAPVARIFTSP